MQRPTTRPAPIPRARGATPLATLASSALALLALALVALVPGALAAQSCPTTVRADVVALDQTVWYNRLGAYDPHAMIFALRHDVESRTPGAALAPGNVRLRSYKRPRPMVLRVNEGDCLEITFQNLLATTPQGGAQPATRHASVHVIGMQLVGGIGSDGSFVGRNPSSLAAPGETRTYTLYAQREGTFFLYSTGATSGGEGNGGALARGLFGAVNVQPKQARWYRSQVSEDDLRLATIGTTPTGQPRLNYAAVYPDGHARAGRPILGMLDASNRIVHSDLNAAITGPGADGRWPAGSFPTIGVQRDREQPFREFTVIFHDEGGIVQAFPEFSDPRLEFTLHSGRDAFAINYGTGGVGSEVLANRKGLGPMGKCPECKTEEFFLSSWAVGDPAMVVDLPANASNPSTGNVATRVLYPDDPSNVHQSYLGDRVKIRNLHAGPKEHHIFHLHAHQWLRSPDADGSSYLDSQAIGPGSGFTYEISYSGSGNRNQTVGDAIFHCHFYPHFAQGMWGLWRVHDVFEAGTQLDPVTRLPVPGARTLPDAEIAAGTAIPALVPMPGRPLPLMPSPTRNPGYPHYIAGKAGHRPPKPPLGTAFDGGLPRHVITGGEAQARDIYAGDVDKTSQKLSVQWLPENGTAGERVAMDFHARRTWPTSVQDLNGTVSTASFVTNGLPPKAGAPFADPCVNDRGESVGVSRSYRVAAFQLDVKYNKSGWHYPQHRMFALWDDVQPTMSGARAPQPLFMRTTTNDCIDYRIVNLVPQRYEMDDYQVATPTDVIGQHIHLVKFDVTSSDGAANGFNYESGALAPGEVRERIAAIRAQNGCTGGVVSASCPVAKAHPVLGAGPNGDWVGAQELIERWYTDDVLNASGQDRTLRSVFSHDHFGPSTHQQTGLYAGLIGEPRGSRWRDPESGAIMGSRRDGGPTSWRADILTADAAESFREFNLMFSDFVPAYRAEASVIPSPEHAINPAGVEEAGIRDIYKRPSTCPNGTRPPCPELVSSIDVGTMTVNYRNEPLALRVFDPATRRQAAGDAGDLSLVYSSSVRRADPKLNVQPTFYPPLTGGIGPNDPYTPLLRAYENDRVQVRVMVGGQEEGHNLSVHGLKWQYEPSWGASGWRSSQFMGISEHFEFVLPPLPGNTRSRFADYLYKPGSSSGDQWQGLWGLIRAYRNTERDLLALPNSLKKATNETQFNGVCPRTAPVRRLAVTAVTAQQALADGAIVYNGREGLRDATAALYVRTSDLDASGRLRAGVVVEPLVLRANAGDCIELALANRLPATMPDQDGWSGLPLLIDGFNKNHVRPSSRVGLHPLMLTTDVTRDGGGDIGGNNGQPQLAGPGETVTYRWYAGHLALGADNVLRATPAEYGAVNLVPSDPIKHSNKGLVGALIIEPQGSQHVEVGDSPDGQPDASRATADIRDAAGQLLFREFVLLFQDDLNLRDANGAVSNLADADDAEDSGQKAFNYRTEPFWARMNYSAGLPHTGTRLLDYHAVLSNGQVGGDPETPVFKVKAGTPVRFRLLHPGGHQRNHVFQLHGHGWQESPWSPDGLQLSTTNPRSTWTGSIEGIGPTSQFNLLLTNGAGGQFKIAGDYLFRDMTSAMFEAGLWGIMRVLPP